MNAETEEKYRKVGHALIHFIAEQGALRTLGEYDADAQVSTIKTKALELVCENFTREELQDFTADKILEVVCKTGNMALEAILKLTQSEHA